MLRGTSPETGTPMSSSARCPVPLPGSGGESRGDHASEENDRLRRLVTRPSWRSPKPETRTWPGTLSEACTAGNARSSPVEGIINDVSFIYPAGHPGVSDVLAHLCGRARQDGLPADVTSMAPQDRLSAILWTANLRGFPPYGGVDPVVSFTESRPEGLAYLIREKSWAPWGIVLDRDSVFELGGGPVWYVRGDMWNAVTTSSLASVRSWFVRLQPGESEWLHEREWRMPTERLELSMSRVQAVIVGDPYWSPGTQTELGTNEMTGKMGWREEPPHLVQGVPRWWWNAVQGRFDVLPPWEGYPHPA